MVLMDLIILGLALGQAAVLIIASFSSLRERPYNLYLILILSILIVIETSYVWSLESGVPLEELRLLLVPLGFFVMPSVYLYVRLIALPQMKWSWKMILHFIPGLVVGSISIVHWLRPNLPELPRLVLDLLPFRSLLINPIYLALSFLALIRHQRVANQNLSDGEQVQLKWVKMLLYIFSALALFDFLDHWYFVDRDLSSIWFVALAGTFFALGLVAMKHSSVIGNIPKDIECDESESLIQVLPIRKELRPKSNLSEVDLQRMKQRVDEILKNDKPYLNPNFCLSDLAKLAKLSTHQTSEVLNRGLKKRFYDLISSYRIEEAMEKMKDPGLKDDTIITIAFSVGFNSKSSFNTAFRKYTGLTPSDFRLKESA